MRKWGLPVMATVLAIFGAVTLFMSSAVIFDLFGVREQQGNYVLSVVVTNLLCGLLYLPAAWGLFTGRRWAITLLVVAALLLVFAFAGLMLHIGSGGVYETRTVGALVFRLVLTLLFAFLGRRLIRKP